MGQRGWIAVGLVSLWAASSLAASGGSTVAIVLKVKNDVRQHAPDGDWQPAKTGMQLTAGHQLRTGEDSFCALIFQDDQSMLKIASNTEVTVDVTPATAGQVSKRIYVALGNVWARAAKLEGRAFEIETPTSVASVKGSAGYDSVDTSGASRLYVEDGLWGFGNRFGAVDVGRGFDGFSDGLNPPVVTPTEEGEGPSFARLNPIPGVEPGSEGAPRDAGPEGGTSELRLGMQAGDGTARSLIIRHQPKEQGH